MRGGGARERREVGERRDTWELSTGKGSSTPYVTYMYSRVSPRVALYPRVFTTRTCCKYWHRNDDGGEEEVVEESEEGASAALNLKKCERGKCTGTCLWQEEAPDVSRSLAAPARVRQRREERETKHRHAPADAAKKAGGVIG